MYRNCKKIGEQKREKILEFIIKYITEHGYSPTYPEIGAAVGLSSKHTVWVHINKLRDEGKINYTDYEPRTITVPGYAFVRVSETIMEKDTNNEQSWEGR